VAGVFLLILLVVFLVSGVILMAQSRRTYKHAQMTRRQYGIPEGRITYTDLNKPAEPIFSEELRLTGKPDYIVNVKGQYIPVEVKTSVTDRPYRNHVMQLATYCLLLEEKYNQAVPFGVLVYGDGRQFKIPFEAHLKGQVTTTLEEMRVKLATGSIERNHNVIAKCQYCSLRIHCSQRIG
jgi:CRISPR-associated exonuclease Cas4